MAGKSSQRAPAGLGTAGKRLWVAVSDGLQLRADEVAILESAARTADQVAALERLVASSPLMVAGSRNQSILHPGVGELRLQRQLLAALLGRLDVPEAVDGIGGEWDSMTNSQRARKAAHARWTAA